MSDQLVVFTHIYLLITYRIYMYISNLLKPFILSGKIHCIIAKTLDECKTYIIKKTLP